MAGECSHSESGVSSHSRDSHEKQDKVDMRANLALQIPLDLTFEILMRLPAKSLKRFQCVSKEWLSIIRNQVFIDSFRSMSQTRSRFLVAVRLAENRVILLSSSHNETEVPTTSLVTNLQVPRHGCRFTSLHTNLEMTVSSLPVDLVHCSSIHGLFCLSHPSHPGRFTICNPSTRQVITLPDIKPSSGRIKRIHILLGYDPVGNEYKALCSTALRSEPCQDHKVLTIGGGNLSWRSIKATKTPPYTVITNGICINGMVYFGGLTTRRQEKTSRIFRFNVRGEAIRSISTYPQVSNHVSLINYNGKLATVSPLPRARLGSFDLWVLDDFNNVRRWLCKRFNVHHFVLHLSGEIELKILGMNNNNEVVIGPLKLPPKQEPLYIYYYNTKFVRGQNLIRRVELKGFEEFGCNHTSDEQCVCQLLFSTEHFESLVSL